jgi:hypothetical protein
LSEIDDLLEIDGVATCMAELRLRFGRRVQQLLEAEARKALGVVAMAISDTAAAAAIVANPLIALNGPARTYEEERAMAADEEDDGHDHLGCFDDQDDEPEPVRIRVGFARRPRRH